MKNTQVKSTEALKYLWKLWIWSGVYPVQKYNFLQYLHGGFVLFGMNLAWAASLLVNRIYLVNFEEFLDNVPMDLTAIGCFFKFAVILKMHHHLKHVSDLIDELDERVLINVQHKSRIAKFIKLCHGLFMVFIGCYFCSATTNLTGTLIFRHGKLFHEAWLPFDVNKSAFNYGCALAYQYIMILILGSQVAVFDVCVPTYLIVLTAHLEFLMERTANINTDEKELSHGENYKELVACIKDHRSIMRIFNILQNTIGYAIFFQFVTTSLVIVSQTVDFIIYNPSPAQLTYKGLFVSAVILEILPCCYYSNQFMVISDKFVSSIYSCNWFNQNQKFKRAMIIFMQMTQQKKVLVAGKIVPITLATFVSIMKMTYSLVTLALNIQK